MFNAGKVAPVSVVVVFFATMITAETSVDSCSVRCAGKVNTCINNRLVLADQETNNPH